MSVTFIIKPVICSIHTNNALFTLNSSVFHGF